MTLAETMLMAANESPYNILVDNAGLNPTVAQNIVDRRQTNEYDSLDELASVSGVDQTTFDTLANWLM